MTNQEAIKVIQKNMVDLVVQIEELKQRLSNAIYRKYKIGDRFITDCNEPSTLTEIQEDKDGVYYLLTDDATLYASDSYEESDLDGFKRLN